MEAAAVRQPAAKSSRGRTGPPCRPVNRWLPDVRDRSRSGPDNRAQAPDGSAASLTMVSSQPFCVTNTKQPRGRGTIAMPCQRPARFTTRAGTLLAANVTRMAADPSSFGHGETYSIAASARSGTRALGQAELIDSAAARGFDPLPGLEGAGRVR
jgi:hypothetical protein